MVQQAKRIQTSLLNGVEHKALVWLANRQPKWMTSDGLSCIGIFGAVLIGAGYLLTDISIAWIWLSTFGLLVHWYGDSLDGTLARVRNCQRPLYGYYLDHTLDAITEGIMFVGMGLSGLMRLEISLAIFIVYLLLTINVSINAHLKSEFCLTYAKLGPTEFRLVVALINTVYFFVTPLQTFRLIVMGHSFSSLDLGGMVIVVILFCMYCVTVVKDLADYNRMDPLHKQDNQ